MRRKNLKDQVSPYVYDKYLKKYDPDWEPNRKARKQAQNEARRRWWGANWLAVIGAAAAVISAIATIIGVLKT